MTMRQQENTKRKPKPSLSKDELARLKEEEAMCPFGRQTIVGSTKCCNCIFNRLDDGGCYGNTEDVRKHMRRLGLDY